MALTDQQKLDYLYKELFRVSRTSSTLDFFEEPYLRDSPIFDTEIWAEASSIPASAPSGMLNGDVVGVVKRYIDLVLNPVAGKPEAFTHSDLHDVIPFNLDDTGSYNYVVKDSTGTIIPFGQYDWIQKGRTLVFNNGLPSNLPPKISFYQYVGRKGVGTSGTGASCKSYLQTFTNSDLTSGKITINHNFGSVIVNVVIIDQDNKVVIPDDIKFLGSTQVELDLVSYLPLVGVYTVLVTTGKKNTTITNADLVGGKAIIYHNLGINYVNVSISDSSNNVILPDNIRIIDVNKVEIDLSSYAPIIGTYNVLITAGEPTYLYREQKTSTILSMQSQTLDILDITRFKTVKYTYYFKTDTKYQTGEILIVNKGNLDIDYSISNKVGDKLSYEINLFVVSSEVEFNNLNKELDTMNVIITRENIIQ